MAEFAVVAVTVDQWQLTVGLLWQLDCEFELAWNEDDRASNKQAWP